MSALAKTGDPGNGKMNGRGFNGGTRRGSKIEFGANSSVRQVETLIATNEPDLVERIKRVLNNGRIFHVAAVANDGCQALRLAFTSRLELVVMSFEMPHMDGIETAHYMKQLKSPPVVIIMGPGDSPGGRARAMAAGADGYVCCGGGLEEGLSKILSRFNR